MAPFSGISKNVAEKKTFLAHLNTYIGDNPSGPVVKNPLSKARDTGSIPGPERFHTPWSKEPHALQVLSPFAATTEVHSPTSCALQRRVASIHYN